MTAPSRSTSSASIAPSGRTTTSFKRPAGARARETACPRSAQRRAAVAVVLELRLLEQRQRGSHGDLVGVDVDGGEGDESMRVVAAEHVETDHPRGREVEDQVDGAP